MSQKSRVPFRVVRFKNFLVHLLKNKMAFIGLVILLFFSFLAVASPIITPYAPTGAAVSGQYNPPSWITSLTGTKGYSQNSEFSGLIVQPGLGVGLTIYPNQTQNSVSFTVNIPRSGGATVMVAKTLSYIYDGPPQSFAGQFSVTPTGLGSNGADATVSIQRGTISFPLWEENIVAGSYQPPSILKYPLNLGSTSFSPGQAVFDKKTTYIYQLQIVIPGGVSQASFSVTNFQLFLYGNTWGILGTDNGGNDIFTQLIYGSRVSLLVGLVATFIGIGVGLVVGLLAGYLGRVVDEVLMRFTDMMLVLPGLPLLIVLIALLGPSLWNIIGVLGFLGWMGFARVIRSQVLSLRERPFIEAAKASGAGTGYITVKHIFPNIVGLTYVNLALSVPAAIVGEAALSFLGLGPQTVISWGQMLELANGSATTSGLLWWWIVPPGLAIAILSLSFILMGYALDEMFNPRLRRRR